MLYCSAGDYLPYLFPSKSMKIASFDLFLFSPKRITAKVTQNVSGFCPFICQIQLQELEIGPKTNELKLPSVKNLK